MTLVLLWNLPAIGERVERKPRVRPVSRLGYAGTFGPAKPQKSAYQPSDPTNTVRGLPPHLAALFALALDD